MLRHTVRHIFRTARPTNFKLGTRMEGDDPLSHWRHDLQNQRSRSQGHVLSLSRLGPMLYLNPAATLFVYSLEHFVKRPLKLHHRQAEAQDVCLVC